MVILGKESLGWRWPAESELRFLLCYSCLFLVSSEFFPQQASHRKMQINNLHRSCHFISFFLFLVLWQNGAGRGGKLQQGNYITQSLPEDLMELHDSLLIISPLGSNYMLGTFNISTFIILKFPWIIKTEGPDPKA